MVRSSSKLINKYVFFLLSKFDLLGEFSRLKSFPFFNELLNIFSEILPEIAHEDYLNLKVR